MPALPFCWAQTWYGYYLCSTISLFKTELQTCARFIRLNVCSATASSNLGMFVGFVGYQCNCLSSINFHSECNLFLPCRLSVIAETVAVFTRVNTNNLLYQFNKDIFLVFEENWLKVFNSSSARDRSLFRSTAIIVKLL